MFRFWSWYCEINLESTFEVPLLEIPEFEWGVVAENSSGTHWSARFSGIVRDFPGPRSSARRANNGAS